MAGRSSTGTMAGSRVKIYNNTLTKKAYDGTYPGEGGNWDFAIELFNISGLKYTTTRSRKHRSHHNKKGNYAFCTWIHHNKIGRPTANTHFERAGSSWNSAPNRRSSSIISSTMYPAAFSSILVRSIIMEDIPTRRWYAPGRFQFPEQ